MISVKNPCVFVMFILLWLCMAVPGTYAQEEEIYLTMEECVNKGLENSAALHAALMQSKEARAILAESYTTYFPVISTSFAYSHLSETDPFTITIPIPGNPVSQEIISSITDSYSFNLSIKQPLFTGFRILNNTGKALAGVKASTALLTRARNELVYTIKEDFWNLVKVVEMKKVADENFKVVDVYNKDIANLFGQGLVTHNDVLKSQIRLSRAEVVQIDAGNMVKLAQLKLAISMGRKNAVQIFPVVSDYSAIILPGDPENLLEDAITKRPESAVLRAQIDVSRKDVDLSYSTWYPSLYLAGNLAYARPNQRYFPPEDEFQFSWDIGVYAVIDANGWYSAPFKTEQAGARLSALLDSEIQLHQAITMEVTRAWLDAGKLARQVEVAEIILNQAGENEKIVTRNFESGVALNSELLEARLQKNQAKLELTSARVDYEIALLELRKAAGYNPDDLSGDTMNNKPLKERKTD